MTIPQAISNILPAFEELVPGWIESYRNKPVRRFKLPPDPPAPGVSEFACERCKGPGICPGDKEEVRCPDCGQLLCEECWLTGVSNVVRCGTCEEKRQ